MDIQFRETKALWEGALEQPALAYARGADEISASIGEPFQLGGRGYVGWSLETTWAAIVFILYNSLSPSARAAIST